MAGRGRPTQYPEGTEWKNVSIRLPREIYLGLRDASLRQTRETGRHVGMAEIVRDAVDEYINRTKQENET